MQFKTVSEIIKSSGKLGGRQSQLTLEKLFLRRMSVCTHT